ncbi:NFX1-type zinc finger-containing protein 1-like [Strongylocentrotus purpuratus]|uniref:NFX1-type zinc finger-containing protein 1 n=1 Tax=Strongylocentrotus purpuratus TaxID=7668 RepID=A0A7M7N8X5_STRPU|nr:NFX1-type zinc finger-containing protein 1-like [Strongylocentrotus purpuratus]
MKCLRRCRHTQCKHPCSEPCDVCTKRCNWKCEHHECKTLCCEPCDRPPCNKPCSKKRKCGHPCIGLCGEICPNKCRICDKEDLEQRFFGTEDIQTARYIQLEDCGHYFEVEGLDKFLGLGIKSDGAEIFTKLSVKTCPRCEKPIQLSRRYSNLLRESLAIKPRIVEKLQDARNSNDDKHLLLKVSSAVMSAKETIRLLLPKSPLALSKYSLSSRFGRDLVESRKSSILDKLHELLQASTEELHRHTKSLPNVLVDQHANDLWNEMNRVTIMCDLAEVLRGGATEPTKVPKLLNILGRDMNMTLAHDLLNGIRTANGISHDTGSGLHIFKRTPRLSFDVTMWFTCAKGHPVSNHHLKKGACKDCDLEKDEQERARSEASAAVGRPRDNVPGQRNLGGQQDQRRRGRGRGRRGRGGRGGRRGGHQRIYVPCYA